MGKKEHERPLFFLAVLCGASCVCVRARGCAGVNCDIINYKASKNHAYIYTDAPPLVTNSPRDTVLHRNSAH